MASLEIAWSLRAVSDVAEVTQHLASDNPEAADRWQAALTERVERVAEFPHSGRVVPEFGRADLREVILGRYRVVYRLTHSHVILVTVREAHRKFPDEPDLD